MYIYNTRISNGNVFSITYNNVTSYSRIANRNISNIKDSKYLYGYYNKYLKNDSIYQSISSQSITALLFNKADNLNSFSASDYCYSLSAKALSSLSSFYFNKSITGINGYLYIYYNNDFAGWYFSALKSAILKYTTRRTSFTADLISRYYMSLQSYYLKINDHELNNSYLCSTRITYSSASANLFIKGKPTYISTIAIMNDNNQVLAIGKLCKPILKLNFIPMSFKLRFFN